MPEGVSHMHTSVPRGDELLVGDGSSHVVVCEAASTRVQELLAALARDVRGPLALLCTGAPPSIEPSVDVSVDENRSALASRLAARLADAAVGVRVYVVGDEGFVRRLAAVGAAAGLLADELRTEVVGAPVFRVFCVHCRTVTEPVAETIARCAGCDRMLLVYHHFSRRKAAYMGFQADAEVPGDVPAGRSGLPCP